ncbi:HOOK protein-domain-containing protein [Entophlyctis helioformis]|nr:HOOK protein-domain-containing protein [Entophlyctis helioformis]
MAAASAQALLAWLNSLDGVSSPPSSLQDLADGTTFLEVLHNVDPQWFKLPKITDMGDNWVYKFNTIKRLYKLMESYFEEFLGQDTSDLGFDGPSLQLAAQGDPEHILRLAHFVVALSVQSEDNQRFVTKIQNLSQFDQHELMVAIESIMSRLRPLEDDIQPSEVIQNMAPASMSTRQQLELESVNMDMRTKLEKLQHMNDQLLAEKQEATARIDDLEHTLTEFKSAGNVDFLLRTEIDKLKSELDKSENQRLEFESIVEKQSIKINEMTKKADQASRLQDDNQRLRDQVDEFRHAADKLQKSEAMLDKYKKRIDETTELKRTIKVLEEQLRANESRNNALEDEYRKANSFKSLIETYKGQLSSLEEKASAMQVENTKLAFELSDTKVKYQRYEAEHNRDQELIQELQERIRDLEFGVELRGSTDGAAPASGGDDRVQQLEIEIHRLRTEKSEDSKRLNQLLVLENLLDDANRFKSKLEEDYRRAIEKNMSLENELTHLRNGTDRDGNSSNLRTRLQEVETELARVKSQKSADSPVRDSGSPMSPDSVSGDPVKTKKKLDQLSSDNSTQASRIASLSMEKEALQNTIMDLKERLQQHDRMNSELRATLAASETRGQSTDQTTQNLAMATQQITLLKDQNAQYQDSLRKAKEHIVLQNKKIQNQDASGKQEFFTEALESLQQSVKSKEMELERAKKEVADTRTAARRETRLMMSAFTELGMRFLQQAAMGVSAGAGNGGVSGTFGSPRTKSPATSSWLGQQRQRFDGGSPSARRR